MTTQSTRSTARATLVVIGLVLATLLVLLLGYTVRRVLTWIPVAGMVQIIARDVWDERRGRPKPQPTVGEEERPADAEPAGEDQASLVNQPGRS